MVNGISERSRTATVVALALVGATTTRSRHLQTYGSFGQFVLVTRLAEMVVLTSFVEIVQVQSVPVNDTTTKPGACRYKQRPNQKPDPHWEGGALSPSRITPGTLV